MDCFADRDLLRYDDACVLPALSQIRHVQGNVIGGVETEQCATFRGSVSKLFSVREPALVSLACIQNVVATASQRHGYAFVHVLINVEADKQCRLHCSHRLPSGVQHAVGIYLHVKTFQECR